QHKGEVPNCGTKCQCFSLKGWHWQRQWHLFVLKNKWDWQSEGLKTGYDFEEGRPDWSSLLVMRNQAEGVELEGGWPVSSTKSSSTSLSRARRSSVLGDVRWRPARAASSTV